MDPTILIGDIVEHETDAKKPVELSDIPFSATGFPQNKRRWKTSAFKQRRTGNAAGDSSEPNPSQASSSQEVPSVSKNASFEAIDKERIDRENRQKLESMSPAEIAQAQQDIMSSLNPTLIQKLLRRANIDEQPESSPFEPPTSPTKAPPTETQDAPKIHVVDASQEVLVQDKPQRQATVEDEPADEGSLKTEPSTSRFKIAADYDENQAPPQIPPDLMPITDLPKRTHFPAPPTLPDLDPSDPNFLSSLHEKYFPDLPADPSKLAWMAPVPTEDSVADKDSPYYPHPEISVNALRFDFRGRFLSPRVSRSIPSSKGLHHHGEAPEAAGYTVAELAILARSAVPAQRCMAFQTLGRIMYRLGKGDWGKTENDPIAMGVWSSVKQGRVLDTLTEAAMHEGGHRGSRAYATEALWLFEKGGWKEKFKGR